MDKPKGLPLATSSKRPGWWQSGQRRCGIGEAATLHLSRRVCWSTKGSILWALILSVWWGVRERPVLSWLTWHRQSACDTATCTSGVMAFDRPNPDEEDGIRGWAFMP